MTNTTIWKYTLRSAEAQVLALPSGARPLYAAMIRGVPVLYAHVDPYAPLVIRQIYLQTTGSRTLFAPQATALGALTSDSGETVVHVFIAPEE
jgi:hypothetical protein